MTVILWTWFLKEFHIVYACSEEFLPEIKEAFKRLISTPHTYGITTTTRQHIRHRWYRYRTYENHTISTRDPDHVFSITCFIVYVSVLEKLFTKISHTHKSFAFPIKKWRNPLNVWCQRPHLRNRLRQHLRQHLHPYRTSLPFHPLRWRVCFMVCWFMSTGVDLSYERPTQKGQSGGHHKLSLLLLATYQKHFPAKFDRTDVHLSKLMHRNRWAEKCPQTTSWRRYRHRYYVAHLLLPMWYVKRHRKCFMTMLDLYKKTRNHEMVSREWSVECSSKFPLISIRLPIPATSDVAATASSTLPPPSAQSTIPYSLFCTYLPLFGDPLMPILIFYIYLYYFALAVRAIYFTKIARTGERVRRMAYACFSNAITCAWFFIKKHAQANVCVSWCEWKSGTI